MENTGVGLNTDLDDAATLAHARAAVERQDWEVAARLWSHLRVLMPDSAEPYAMDARVAFRLGNRAAADETIAAGLKRFPGDGTLLIESANIASWDGDWASASERWRKMRETWPDVWLGYSAGIAAARSSGDIEKSEQLYEEGEARFPHEVGLLMQGAWTAEAAGDLSIASERWMKILSLAPDNAAVFLFTARCLRRQKRYAESKAILQRGLKRFEGNHEILTDLARLAGEAGRLKDARKNWKQYRDMFPERIDGYLDGGNIARQLNLLDEARAILRAGTQRVADNHRLWVELAHMADGDDAVAVWTECVERFPDEPMFRRGTVEALLSLGRLDEAASAAEAAFARSPQHFGILHAAASALHRARRWDRACTLWRLLAENRPQDGGVQLLFAESLRELGQVAECEEALLKADKLLPDRPEFRMAYARLPNAAHEPDEALTRWREVMSRFPQRIEGYLGVAVAAQRSNSITEAEAALKQAAEIFPNDATPLVQLGIIAMGLSHFTEAAALFARIRGQFPDNTEAYHLGVSVELYRGQVAAADALATEARKKFPSNHRIAMLHAGVHSHIFSSDFKTCISRIDQSLSEFPTQSDIAREALRFRRLAKDFSGTQRKYNELRLVFPDDKSLALEMARAYIDGQAWSEATSLLLDIVRATPELAEVHELLGESLVRAGRVDEAEEALRQGMALHPHHVPLYEHYGKAAGRRGDWQEALRRWTDAQSKFPHQKRFAVLNYDARSRLAESDGGESDERETHPQADVLNDREMLMCFESLGGSGHGCEFGTFQRFHGAEPLSLLRWTDHGTSSDGLCTALEADLAGIGEPEQTALDRHPDGTRMEYWTRDTRYALAMRTFAHEDTVPFDEMTRRTTVRLRYLRNKLLTDLAEGNKIFVYRNMFRNLEEVELNRLHAAVRRYGDNVLLYIKFEDSAHPNGTVEWAQPGLTVAYIDHFSNSPTDEPLGDAFPSYLTICRSAFRMWTENRSTSLGTPAPSH